MIPTNFPLMLCHASALISTALAHSHSLLLLKNIFVSEMASFPSSPSILSGAYKANILLNPWQPHPGSMSHHLHFNKIPRRIKHTSSVRSPGRIRTSLCVQWATPSLYGASVTAAIYYVSGRVTLRTGRVSYSILPLRAQQSG